MRARGFQGHVLGAAEAGVRTYVGAVVLLIGAFPQYAAQAAQNSACISSRRASGLTTTAHRPNPRSQRRNSAQVREVEPGDDRRAGVLDDPLARVPSMLAGHGRAVRRARADVRCGPAGEPNLDRLELAGRVDAEAAVRVRPEREVGRPLEPLARQLDALEPRDLQPGAPRLFCRALACGRGRPEHRERHAELLILLSVRIRLAAGVLDEHRRPAMGAVDAAHQPPALEFEGHHAAHADAVLGGGVFRRRHEGMCCPGVAEDVRRQFLEPPGRAA